MKIITFKCLIIFLYFELYSQFPPAAGQTGSTAIPADSSCFVAWATNCFVERGYINIADTNAQANGSNRASYGDPHNAIGHANNNVVSLGDKGIAVLTFEYPIVNGAGWDFAVFENAFIDTYLELAFVEVSSNETDFFRFPAVSLTPIDEQTGAFGETDPTKIHNLAGKYRVMFGVPFDIDELDDAPLLDKNNITHVRIIDVGGSVEPLYASYDHYGNIINDPFPTPFASGGFDLDAIGVINNTQSVSEYDVEVVRVFPNPASDKLCFTPQLNNPVQNSVIYICNIYGQLIETAELQENCADVLSLPTGLYFVKWFSSNGKSHIKKFVKL